MFAFVVFYFFICLQCFDTIGWVAGRVPAHLGSPGKRSVKRVFVYSSFSVLSEEVGWEERLRNDLFCVEWDVKP